MILKPTFSCSLAVTHRKVTRLLPADAVKEVSEIGSGASDHKVPTLIPSIVKVGADDAPPWRSAIVPIFEGSVPEASGPIVGVPGSEPGTPELKTNRLTSSLSAPLIISYFATIK